MTIINLVVSFVIGLSLIILDNIMNKEIVRTYENSNILMRVGLRIPLLNSFVYLGLKIKSCLWDGYKNKLRRKRRRVSSSECIC